jgi:thymidylate synthase (FAD)
MSSEPRANITAMTTTAAEACASMRETTPSVHLIAKPAVDLAAMHDYLADVGGDAWLQRREAETGDSLNAAQLLVEFCGRVCYRSWEPGLNKNVSRVRLDQRDYLRNLLSSFHGSVLEHANFTFVFRNVSRVFTHELVRHRAGSAFSQESLRYVRLTDIGFRVPAALEPIRDQVVNIVEQLEEFQVSAAEALGLDDDGVPFAVKKEITSALRRLAPLGLSTDIVWTANLRTLRHVVEMRTSPGAEEELRMVFDRVASITSAAAPSLFQDFTRADDGSWVPEFRKV